MSLRFHSLASAELYRLLNFDISCVHADEIEDPSSRAADALQTINTSQYNYAQHVKCFKITHKYSTPVLSSAPHYADPLVRVRSVFDSSSDASKLLSTAILQMVRQASALESFMLVSKKVVESVANSDQMGYSSGAKWPHLPRIAENYWPMLPTCEARRRTITEAPSSQQSELLSSPSTCRHLRFDERHFFKQFQRSWISQKCSFKTQEEARVLFLE